MTGHWSAEMSDEGLPQIVFASAHIGGVGAMTCDAEILQGSAGFAWPDWPDAWREMRRVVIQEVQKRMLDPALDALWPPIKLLWAWMVMQSDLVWHWIGALAHALIGLIGWLIDLFTDV
jgi:hypothetical protein